MTTKSTKNDKLLAEHTAKVADAEARVREHADSLEAAQADVADLKARLASDDESVTPDDYARALAAVDRAHLLLDGAEKRVKGLKARAPFRPWVADALAEVLADELKVPVHVVEKMPAEAPEHVPAMFLVQPRAAEWAAKGWSGEPWGSFKSSVEVKFFRPTWAGATIDGRDVQKRLNGHFGKVGHVSVSSIGTRGAVDSLTLSVSTIYPDLPSIPSGTLASHTVRGFAEGISPLIKGDPSHKALTADSRGFAKEVDVHAIGVRMISHSVTSNTATKGVRRITIDVHFDVWINEGMAGRAGDVNARINQAINSRAGKVHPHLGRVREVKLTRETMNAGEVLMQTGRGHYRRRDRGAVDVFKATFTIEAAA